MQKCTNFVVKVTMPKVFTKIKALHWLFVYAVFLEARLITFSFTFLI